MKDFNSITTWSVSKGVATPKKVDRWGDDPIDHKKIGYNRYGFSDEEAQQHTYATNAPDGSYSTDCFGKIVWQYKDWITEKQDFNEWIDVTDNFADSITVKNNWPSEKRRFLPFIQAL